MKRNRWIFQWDENPLLSLLVFWVTGICFIPFLKDFFPGFSVLVFLMGCTHLVLKWRDQTSPSIRMFRVVSAALVQIWIGGSLAWLHTDPPIERDVDVFTCSVLENLGQTKDGQRVLCRLQTGRGPNLSRKLEGKVILMVRHQPAPFEHGTRLLLRHSLDTIPRPDIPGQFDAATFFGRQGIRYQVFCDNAHYQILPGSDRLFFRALALDCRHFLETRIAGTLSHPDDAAMVSALLLGIRKKMDAELKAAYASAGVTHILAVSGMHVALIVGFLSVVLGFVRRLPFGHYLFPVLMLLFLWFYALVTGLSPSVLRAVTVFSVMQLNEIFRKPPLALNGLSLGTLILLVVDPNLVYDLGYQLSFAAVYGILSFERPIRQWWRPRNKALRWIWENSSVSLAATLTTFPVILYYFHQFPVYFLLANLVAVPVSNGLIYLSLAHLALGRVPFLGVLTDGLIHGLLWFLNQFVLGIGSLPGSSIDAVFLQPVSLVFIFLALFFLLGFLQRGNQKWLQFSLLGFLFCLMAEGILGWYQWKFQSGTFVMRTKKEWMLAEIRGKSGQLVSLAVQQAKTSTSFEARSIREGWQVKEVGLVHPPKKTGPEGRTEWLVYKGRSFLFVNGYLKKEQWQLPQADVLVLQKGSLKTLESAVELVRPREVWVDWKPQTEQSWRNKHPSPGFRFRNFHLDRCQLWRP
jgi:ComEC/Rec2-related protein